MSVFDNDTCTLFFREFPDILSVLQLSHMLNINEKAAYQLVRENLIEHFKIGRTFRIPKLAVIKYMNKATGDADFHVCHN